MKRVVCCVTLLTLIAGCHKPEEYVLGPSTVDQVLDVTLSSTSIAADGISRTRITAQLDPRTDADKREITFTTTAGTLVAGVREGLVIVLTADRTGQAVVISRSATTPGTAQIEVTVSTVRRVSAVRFEALQRDEVFDVSASPSSIPADGFSRTVITARLKTFAPLQQRTVTFETTAGLLIATGQSSARVVTVTADVSGLAQVELQSEKTLGTAQVRVTTLTVAYELAIPFTPVDPSQIIRVSTDRSSVPADGVTPLVVSATVAPGLPSARRSVSFISTLGRLIPSTVDADGSNVARTSLVSNFTGPTRITATVDGTTAETTATFTQALPNELHLSVDAAQLKTGGTTTVRVTLIRETGIVSPNLTVSYSARTNTGASIGSFSAVTLAVSGSATATFNLGTTDYLGPVTIRASAEGGADDSVTLRVVP